MKIFDPQLTGSIEVKNPISGSVTTLDNVIALGSDSSLTGSFTGSFKGDGSELVGVIVDSGSWDGIFTGSAAISGSLNISGAEAIQLTVEKRIRGQYYSVYNSTAATYAGYLITSGDFEDDATTDLGLASGTGRNIRFYTANNPVEKMRLTTDGNLGIGIAPSSTTSLHIYKSDPILLIQASNTSGDAELQFFPRDGSNVAHLQSIKGEGSSLVFSTGGNSGNSYVPTEALTISSGGDATFSQVMASTVNPSIFIKQTGSSLDGGGGSIIFGTSTIATATNYNASIQAVRTASGAGSSELRFLTTHQPTNIAAQTRLTISSLGDVGIGSAPITSPNGADRSLSVHALQDSSIILGDNVETWEIYQNDNLHFSYGTTPTRVLKLDRTTGLANFTPTGGNGTGAVNAIHLKNTGTSANDGTSILFTAGTSADGAAIKSTGQAFNSSDLRFFTGGSAAANERLTISSGGLATFSNDIELSRAARTTIYASSTNQGVQLKSNGSGVLQLNADGGGNVTICENGSNVGIGTTTLDANANLTVFGNYRTDFIRDYYGGNRAYILRFGANTASSGHVIGSQIVASLASDDVNGSLEFYTKNAGNLENHLTISSTGNVGIATTPSTVNYVALTVEAPVAANGLAGIELKGSGNSAPWRMISSWDGTDPIWGLFYPNDSAYKLTITSGGAASFGGSVTADGGMVINGNTGLTSNNYGSGKNSSFLSSHASQPKGILIHYTAASPNATGNFFIECKDTSADRFIVRSNGGVANYSGNNVNLSDESVKKNITDTPNSLDIIKNLEVKDFQYIDQTDNKIHTGVIAQQVLQTDPSLVDQSGKLKMVYNTDLMFKMLKAIQEQQTQIEELKSEIQLLKNN